MSLAALHAETASGEGAHGPDRSRLAMWDHCRTNRRKRQSAAGLDHNAGWLDGRGQRRGPRKRDFSHAGTASTAVPMLRTARTE